MIQSQNTADQQQIIIDLITSLNTIKLNGGAFTADGLAAMEGSDDPRVKDWVKDNTNITSADYKAALKRVRIKAEFGVVPMDAMDLVKAIVRRDQMACMYNGLILCGGKPQIDDGTGNMVIPTPEEMAIPVIAMKVHFTHARSLDLVDFTRKLRLISDKLKLGFPDRSINDAVTQWQEEARQNRRFDLFMGIHGIDPQKRTVAEEMWSKVARAVFVTDTTTTEAFVIAVLKKFIHQVKNKIMGKVVDDHLMPVFLGGQGVGKSTFVRQMTKPVEELSLNVDFKMIEDDRNIDIWKSYVLFLDEMGYASKTNVDTVKNAITASTLTRRPLYTNGQVAVKQNATFIGCSNKELEQLIKDPTGIRRFIALRFKARPDWATMNQIDWKLLWGSVDHESADPVAGFRHKLRDIQEETREMARVEHWMDEFDLNDLTYQKGLNDKLNCIKALDLYACFREFEDAAYPGPMKTSLTEWGNEMKRIAENQPNLMRFTRLPRKATGFYYRFVG